MIRNKKITINQTLFNDNETERKESVQPRDYPEESAEKVKAKNEKPSSKKKVLKQKKNFAWKVSIVEVILVRIFPHLDWIRTRITPSNEYFLRSESKKEGRVHPQTQNLRKLKGKERRKNA